jgi:hypothetical protein
MKREVAPVMKMAEPEAILGRGFERGMDGAEAVF